jgi:hypothetical protein
MIAAILLTLLFSSEPVCEAPQNEPTPMFNECQEPLCTTVKGSDPPVTGPCDSSCGTWTPGAPVTCGDIVCQPVGWATECRWLCRPSDEW